MNKELEQALEKYGYNIVDNVHQGNNSYILQAYREDRKAPFILKVRPKVFGQFYNPIKNDYRIGKIADNSISPEYVDFFDIDEYYVLVMKDDKMISLNSIIPRFGFDVKAFLDLSILIASALEKLHSYNIIFSDLNPFNMIVNKSLNTVKFIDFETSTTVKEERVNFDTYSESKGTLLYISPEQTGRINQVVDHRTDLYSLGITFYQMITGKVPFLSENPAELIYSHIAKLPTSILEIKPSIPVAIDQIIGKLLSKSVDKRYYSAKALKNDLIYVRDVLEKHEAVDDFILGKNDKSDKIVLNNKLYGRNKEKKIVQDIFNRSSKGGQVLSVVGDTGTGKTSLVSSIYLAITEKEGFLLRSKFEKLKKVGLDYIFNEIFSSFVLQCLNLKEEKKKYWSEVVQQSVGDFGEVLTDIVPVFKELIGEQKPIAKVSSEQILERRNMVFLNLIESICKVGKPVVMFFDDIQLIDLDILKLFELIVTKQIKNLMIIFSYRDEDTEYNFVAKKFIDKIEDLNVSFTKIELSNLEKDAVVEWVDDLIPYENINKNLFVTQLLALTDGNPFYLFSALNMIIEKKYIYINDEGNTEIDINKISTMPTNEDVSAHLAEKIDELSEDEKIFLINLSILGKNFTIDDILLYMEESYSNVSIYVQRLVKKHLLGKSGQLIYFSHDKVQNIVYELLDNDKIKKLHLNFARNIKKIFKEEEFNDDILEKYVYHLNKAIDLIDSEEERFELANSNYIIAEKLKNNGTYKIAEEHLENIILLLPKNTFDKYYDFSIKAYIEYGEILFLNSNYEYGEKIFNEVLNKSKSPIERATIYEKEIVHYAAHHEPKKSMDIAFLALKDLNIKISKKGVKFWTIFNLLKIKFLMRKINIEDILKNEAVSDELALAQMNILGAALVPAYVAYPDFYPLFVLKMVCMSIKNGNSPISTFAWVNYGVILTSLGFYRDGFNYGELAIKLTDKLNAEKFRAKNYYMFAFMIYHWQKPAYQSIKYLKKAGSLGIEIGDYEFSSYAVNNIMHVKFFMGVNIPKLIRKYKQQHKLLESFGKKHTIVEAKYWNQMLIVLNDKDSDGISVKGKIVDESSLMPSLELKKDYSSLTICYFTKMMLGYLAGKYELAMEYSIKSFNIIGTVTGTVFIAEIYFFSALTYLALYKRNKNMARYLKKAKKLYKKMRKWGNNSSENYLSKALIIKAELLGLKNDMEGAIKLYEKAIKNSSKMGNSLDLGIAYELLGRYFLSENIKPLGLIKITKSIDVFENWGALNKSNRLRHEFDVGTLGNEESINISQSINSQTSVSINSIMDMDALTKSIRSFMSNLDFGVLIEKLFDIVLKNSGATRIVYAEFRDNVFLARAEKKVNSAVKFYPYTSIRDKEIGIPKSSLERYMEQKMDILSENFKSDEINKNEHSVLFIPLVYNEKKIGFLYLENDLIKNAFLENHLEFLKLLAGQAAVAIENSMIFEKLNYERDFNHKLIQKDSNMIIGLDRSGIINFVNPTVEKITKYSSAELIGRNYLSLSYQNELEKNMGKIFNAIISENLYDYEIPIYSKDGQKKIIIWNTVINRNSDGEVSIIYGFGKDITEIKKSEEQLLVLQDYLSNIINSMPSIIIGIDSDFNVTQWNSVAEKQINILSNNAIGHNLFELFSELDTEKEKIIKALKTNKKQISSRTYIKDDGDVRYEDIIIFPLISGGKEPGGKEGAVIRIDDVTKKHRLEEMMLQNEKMLSIGGLAAGMAHEINNPLAGMIQTASVISSRLTDVNMPANISAAEKVGINIDLINEYMSIRKIPAMVDRIKDSGKRAAEIIQNMLSFARKGNDEKVPQKLDFLVDKCLEILAIDYDMKKNYDFKNMNIVKEYEPSLPDIYCEPGKIQQVIVNILKNGAEAMSEVEKENKFILRLYKSRSGKYVILEIEDNGPGISEDVKKRIFEPFFTTKPVGKGTGLGLSVSYFIITKNHFGEMSVESKVGLGTKFIIKLPIEKIDDNKE